MITIGADPEFFVSKHGKFVSAHNLIPGTKKAPHSVEKGAVQVDGVALEFNINPATNYEQFQDHLNSVSQTLASMVPGYDFLMDSAIILDAEDLATIPPEALEIGCNPDVNAYSEELNEAPASDSPIRAAGGHIHIGGIFPEGASDSLKWATAMRMARLMDRHVGVYSVLWDKDQLRRQVYGKAGACRVKPYGVEYRSLSNSWVFNPKITEFVYYATIKAASALKGGEDVTNRLYQGIINRGDDKHPFFTNNLIADSLRNIV